MPSFCHKCAWFSFALSALNGQAALDFTDVCLDANLPPLLADHLGDLGELQELATNGHNLDAQPSFAIRAHAVALRIFFGESNAVEELVRLCRVVRRVHRPVFWPRVVRG